MSEGDKREETGVRKGGTDGLEVRCFGGIPGQARNDGTDGTVM